MSAPVPAALAARLAIDTVRLQRALAWRSAYARDGYRQTDPERATLRALVAQVRMVRRRVAITTGRVRFVVLP